jgi:hypothetical protein
MEHVPDTTEYVTAPEPEPPLEVNDNVATYVADVVVTDNTDCTALAIVTVVSTEERSK